MTTSADEGAGEEAPPHPDAHGLDRALVDAWPDDVAEAASRFRLGDVVEGLQLSYGRDAVRRLWRSAGNEPTIGSLVPRDGTPAPRFGLITTQTCDLVDESRDDDQPWFQVCPVVQYPSEASVPKGDHLHRLTGADIGPGVWVADLRIEAPLEKVLLVGQVVCHGFATEEDEIAFAAKLGRRRDRAALADGINRCLRGEFQRKRASERARGRGVKNRLFQVGLRVEDGTRLEPRSVAVHFIGRGPEPSGDDRAWLEEWWDGANAAATASPRPFRMWANTYHDSRCMDVELYEALVILQWW